MALGRQARGAALAALAGSYDEPAIGLPPVAGWAVWDDFLEVGPWVLTTIGAAPTGVDVAPAAATEMGVRRITSTAVSGQGGCYVRGTVANWKVSRGSVWAAKFTCTGSTLYDMYSGFVQTPGTDVAVVTANQFIGVRAIAGNLFGVCKTGASAETTVDLGVTAINSTYQTVGFAIRGTAAAPSVQFYLGSLSDSDVLEWAPIGNPITTNLPTVALYPCAVGVVSRAAATKAAQVDFWALGGRVAR